MRILKRQWNLLYCAVFVLVIVIALTCCHPSCKELPAPYQDPPWWPSRGTPCSPDQGTSLSKVGEKAHIFHKFVGGKNPLCEPFSVADSSFRMALGRKAGWKTYYIRITIKIYRKCYNHTIWELSPWLGGFPPEYSSPLYLWVGEDIFISLNISTNLQSWT